MPTMPASLMDLILSRDQKSITKIFLILLTLVWNNSHAWVQVNTYLAETDKQESKKSNYLEVLCKDRQVCLGSICSFD